MTLFEANYIHVREVDEVFMVGFADHQYDTKHYLLFQLSDDEDGVSKIYLERDHQSQSTYGGITTCELYTDRLALYVDLRAAHDLNTEESFQVSFRAEREEQERLARGLAFLFANTNVFKAYV